MFKVSSFLAGLLILAGVLAGAQTTQASQEDATKPGATASVSAAKKAEAASPGAFVVDLEKHWTTAQGLAVAVAEAMPAEDYSFKPVPEEMSFGEQIMHIAEANYGYCAFLTDAKSPFVELAKDAKIEKAEAVKQLTGSFEYCSAAFSKVTEAELDAVHGTGDHKFVARDVMLGVMIHMVHHRGQAEVYLRLKGIKPPDYKW
jgi:uncharacterized damage-inducible protein DinB